MKLVRSQNTSTKSNIVPLTKKQADVINHIAKSFRATPEEILAAGALAFYSMHGGDQPDDPDSIRAALHDFIDCGFTPKIEGDFLDSCFSCVEKLEQEMNEAAV